MQRVSTNFGAYLASWSRSYTQFRDGFQRYNELSLYNNEQLSRASFVGCKH